jgi:hypothetical protein
MIFLVIKPTISKLILLENYTCSEKYVLWLVTSLHSTGSPKIGLTQKYTTDEVL